MKIYHYHPETGVLLGEGVADKSPLEKNVWLIPAHATTKVPPKAKDGYHCVYNGYTWKNQPIPEPKPEPDPPAVTEQAVMPPLTPEQKLAAAGLTVAELKTLLELD
jgi:hypothetical protein